MSNSTLLFAFGNQKGGVGKSTLTTVFGNYLQGVHGDRYTFAAVDADDLQRTLFNFRCRDLEIDKKEFVGKERELQKLVYEKENEYDLYHILQVPSNNFFDTFVDRFDGSVDFMAIDLPGNLKQAGVMDSYKAVEILFIPCKPNDTELDATVEFLRLYKEVDAIREESGLEPAEKYMIVSRIDRAMSFDRTKYESVFKGVKVLENTFPYSPAAFGRDVKTLLDFKKNKKDEDTEKLCTEIFQVIEKKYSLINA